MFLHADGVPIYKKRQIVLKIESGLLTIKEAARKYNLSENTISTWKKKYSCKVNNNVMNPQEIKIPQATKDIVVSKVHQKEIEALKLKIAALETMIDIAESQFKIEIRKKFGTGQ